MSNIQDQRKEAEQRTINMLKSALGVCIEQYLKDQDVLEILANPNGDLWIDTMSKGRVKVGTLACEAIERAIYVTASTVGKTCTKLEPLLSAELPDSGFRFQAVVPPVVHRPAFSIRKPAYVVYSLDDYLKAGIVTQSQYETLKQAIKNKLNILVVGGTGSGKTTFTNALLVEVATTRDRVVLIEDTRELQCAAEDVVALRTVDNVVTMRDLLKATLRLRPDRIIIGEVRGQEALDLLKCWNTGHPGGVATLHADSAEKGLRRLESLVNESSVVADPFLIAETINLIAFIERGENGKRKLKQLVRVTEYKDNKYVTEATI